MLVLLRTISGGAEIWVNQNQILKRLDILDNLMSYYHMSLLFSFFLTPLCSTEMGLNMKV